MVLWFVRFQKDYRTSPRSSLDFRILKPSRRVEMNVISVVNRSRPSPFKQKSDNLKQAYPRITLNDESRAIITFWPDRICFGRCISVNSGTYGSRVFSDLGRYNGSVRINPGRLLCIRIGSASNRQ